MHEMKNVKKKKKILSLNNAVDSLIKAVDKCRFGKQLDMFSAWQKACLQ